MLRVSNVIIVTALLLSLLINAETSDAISVEYTTYPEAIKPGTTGYIQLKMMNLGTQPIYNLYLFQVKADSPLKIYNKYRDLGSLYPETVKSIILKFEVPETAKSGFYAVEILLRAEYHNYTSSFRFDVPIEVKEEGFIRLNVTPTTIESDEISSITIVIQNAGSDVRDVRIFWIGDGIVPIGESSNLFIPYLKSGETKEVQLKVKAITLGTAILRFEFSYSDLAGNQMSESYVIGLEVESREEDYLRTAIHPEILETGKAGKLIFDISNEGNEELRNILLRWESEILLPTSSNTEFINSIGVGESRTISFDVFVDENAKPGYYPLAVNLKYDSSGNTVAVNRTFGIRVDGNVSIETTFFRADVDKVFVSIANTGNAPAENLVVYASSPYGRAEVFIGDMEPGDEEIIEVDQSGVDSSKPYNLSLKLVYRDVFNQKFVEENQIVVHHPKQSFPVLWLAVGAVLLVALSAGVWLWRKG
jgi:hypothetical protein